MPNQTIPYEAGDKVFVPREQRLATILNVYGDGLKGNHGEVRLDLCGNTPIKDFVRYDAVKHAAFDHTFTPIRKAWKDQYGITKDVPLRAIQIDVQRTSVDHGFNDFDVSGDTYVHRVTVGDGIKKGDYFNVYGPEGSKNGATWLGTLEESLAVHLNVSLDAIHVNHAQLDIQADAELSATLDIVDEVILDFEGAGISSIGASAALKAMADYWESHLLEGHNPQVISEDIDSLTSRLEVMRAEIMTRILQRDVVIERPRD